MFSPGSASSPAGAPRNTSAGRRPIGSPGTTKTGSQRLVRTPNHAQLVQLDSSAGEFARRKPTNASSDDGLDESFSEEMIDETELAASRRASEAAAAAAAAAVDSRRSASKAPSSANETPSHSPPPARQHTVAAASHDVSPATSRSVTPVTPVQMAAGVPMPAGGTAAGADVTLSTSSTQGKRGGSRQRPTTLSSEAVESPASPDPADGNVAKRDGPPKTTATEARGHRVNINAETPAAQRAAQRAREKPPRPGSRDVSSAETDRDATTPPRQFTLGTKHLVGAGSFGTVYRALDTTNNQSIAVKEIRLQHIENPQRAKKELEALEREIRVMQKLTHPNIVKYLGYQRGEGTFNIIMEFVSCGTVGSVLKTFGPLQPIQAALFTKHVLAGLQYLHSKRIAHRDLKGDNLFVDVDGTVKLGDFGTAKELQTIKSTAFNSIAGTPYFMAPEVVKNGGHGLEADIWSVGCCVIQMLGGQPPFKNFENQITVMFQVSKGEIEPQIPKGIPDDARDFILKCCQVDPKARPTVTELLAHPWLASAPPIPSELAAASDAAPYVPPSAQGSSGAPATRAHASRPMNTPPRPTGSGKRAPRSQSGSAAGSRTGSTSPPPRPTSKEHTASRGVAAARQMRAQNDRPSGASSQGTRRQATPKKNPTS